jgi:hypothetical protein
MAGFLAHSSGKYYVIGLHVAEEPEAPSLGVRRAEAVVAALVRAGFCPEKFVALGSHETKKYGPIFDDESGPLVSIALVSPYATEQLREAGLL